MRRIPTNLLQLTVMLLLLTGCTPSNTLNDIHDLGFKKAVVDGYDTNKDFIMTPDETARVTKLRLPAEVESYEGINVLHALEEVSSQGGLLQEVDFSLNKQLSSIVLWDKPKLSTFVPAPLVRNISLHGVGLKEFSIPDMPKLRTLYISGTERVKLQKFSTGRCDSLISLWLGDNNLTDLDLSKYPNLEELECNRTDIEHLDLSMLPKLARVTAVSAPLKSIKLIRSQRLQHLELSPNTQIIYAD